LTRHAFGAGGHRAFPFRPGSFPSVAFFTRDNATLDSTAHALGTIAPLGSADRFRMLSAPGPRARLAAFDVALGEVTDALRFRLDG
ncbi:MAG: hypothetical protein ACKOHN_03985, partial [Actinomycetota bacterium]